MATHRMSLASATWNDGSMPLTSTSSAHVAAEGTAARFCVLLRAVMAAMMSASIDAHWGIIAATEVLAPGAVGGLIAL